MPNQDFAELREALPPPGQDVTESGRTAALAEHLGRWIRLPLFPIGVSVTCAASGALDKSFTFTTSEPRGSTASARSMFDVPSTAWVAGAMVMCLSA